MQLLSSYEKNKDVKISLITRYSEYKPTSENVKIYEIHLFKIPLLDTIYFYFKSIFTMIKIHKKEHIDVLNIHTFSYNLISLLIVRLIYKIPILLKMPIDFSSHLREVYLYKHQKLKSKLINFSWLRFFKKFILPRINFIRILNKRMYFELIELKYPKVQILEIPNGITSKNYLKIKKNDHKFMHFGYVGRLTEFKNLRFLLEVFQKYLKKHPSDKLYIYGTGPDYDYISHFINDNNIETNTILCGFEKNKNKIYSNIDVLINPALSQGISNANLESICTNTFLIAANVSGNIELIDHKKTGLLFNPHNEESLLEQLFYYKEHSDLAQKIIDNAKDELLEKYDIDVITSKIYEFLRFRL